MSDEPRFIEPVRGSVSYPLSWCCKAHVHVTSASISRLPGGGADYNYRCTACGNTCTLGPPPLTEAEAERDRYKAALQKISEGFHSDEVCEGCLSVEYAREALT